MNALRMAKGLGADVTILDIDVERLRFLDVAMDNLHTLYSSEANLIQLMPDCDLLIGAVLLPGAKAPMLISNALVARMQPGSVLVDISIDQGGCFEDSRPTTHAEPTYMVHNSVFYCVENMPGAVPHTSTYALTNVTLPYAVALANKGWRQAMRDDHSLALGLNTYDGYLTNGPVAEAHGREHLSLEKVLS